MEELIKKFLIEHNICAKRVLIGFSGGYDSMCLINILKNLSKELELTIVAAHLNHNWRGEEAKQEELNCKNYCIKNKIKFISETLPENTSQTELEARNQRYLFFEKIANENKIDTILTAHTKTDNVETILYRIIKGTGLKGLTGIPAKRNLNSLTVYRPMLKISREEILQYCKENNLNPNNDSSNQNTDYQRNKIRHKLIPDLKEYNNGVENAVERLIELANDNENILNEFLTPIKAEIFNGQTFDTAKFSKVSLPIKKTLIKNFIEEQNIDFDMKKIGEIIDFIENSKNLKTGNTMSLTSNLWLFCNKEKAELINETSSFKEIEPKEINLEGEFFHREINAKIKVQQWKKNQPKKFPKETDDEAFVDLSNIRSKIYVRNRKKGDKITPFGMKEETKLKKYLINKGIPEFERDSLIILATEKEVLWVHRVGISDKIKVKDIPTHRIEIEVSRRENG